MIPVSKDIIINEIDESKKVDEIKKVENKTKRFSRKNRKTTKFKILIRPENYDFFFKSKNTKL